MEQQLINRAEQARENAYVPYSAFAVGAAIMTKSGNVYSGCNIENASYSLTCCAERVAIFNAVSKGERDFIALAVTADTEEPVSPCGSCRQVMAQFFEEDVQLFLTNLSGSVKTTTIGKLLPNSFTL